MDPAWGPIEYISTSQKPFRAPFSKGLILDYTDIYIYIYAVKLKTGPRFGVL